MIETMTDGTLAAVARTATERGLGALETARGCLTLLAIDLDVAIVRLLLPIALASGLLLPEGAAADPLTAAQATAFARLALDGIAREYPHKPADVLNGDADVLPPRQIHPAFHGCYDWHSAVHGHWMRRQRVSSVWPGGSRAPCPGLS